MVYGISTFVRYSVSTRYSLENISLSYIKQLPPVQVRAIIKTGLITEFKQILEKSRSNPVLLPENFNLVLEECEKRFGLFIELLDISKEELNLIYQKKYIYQAQTIINNNLLELNKKEFNAFYENYLQAKAYGPQLQDFQIPNRIRKN
jgi:hypothetical protein